MLIFLDVSGGEFLVILLAIIVIFGPKKIPEIARTIGKGVREIKKAADDVGNEIKNIKKDTEKDL